MLSFWFWQTLFLAGLLLTTGGLFVPRARVGALFGLAVLTWLFGVKTVHYAFQSRGEQWAAASLRSYEYRTLDDKSKVPRQPAGSRHHSIETPLEVRRFPRELDSWNKPKPLQVVLEATLEPEGRGVSPRITRSSGDPALDQALQSALEAWRFGPVPPGGTRQPELLRVTVKNNYQVTQPGTRFWGFVVAIPVLWGLALWLVPGSRDLRPQLQRLLIAVGMLACLGGLLSYRLSPDQQRFQNAEKQQLFLLIGFGLLVLGPRVMAGGRRWLDSSLARPAQWARTAQGGWTWALLGLLLLILTLGPLGTTNGSEAKLWLKLPGGNSFQTIELVKVLFAVFLAHRVLPLVTNFRGKHERDGTMRLRTVSKKQRLLAVTVGFLALLGTVVLMKDFGPVLLMFLFLTALLAVLGEGRLAGGLVIALAVILVGMNAAGVPDRWRTRVTIWRDPWGVTPADTVPRKIAEDIELPSQIPGGKEQVAYALWAASSGGLQGMGWGQGQPQRVKVVESDFPFMAVAEETGLLGAGCVLALTVFLVGPLAALAHEATRDDAYEKTFLTAGAALLGGQTLLVLVGNLRLFPLTGVTYPFLSYGGASLLVSFGFIVLLVGGAAQPSQHPEFFPEPDALEGRIGTLQRAITVGLVIIGLALLALVLLPGLARTRKVVHVALGTPETGQVSAVASQFRDTRSPASEGNLARTGFGQKDVRMTPLHVALWTATLANRGKEISPTLVRQVTAHDGKVLWAYSPPVGRQVFSERVGEQVVAAMEQVVRSGTGRQAQLLGVRVAGKTGTAQKEPRGQDALFIGFAPVEKPQIAIAVLIEDIPDEEGGGTVAAPLAKTMIAATLRSEDRKP